MNTRTNGVEYFSFTTSRDSSSINLCSAAFGRFAQHSFSLPERVLFREMVQTMAARKIGYHRRMAICPYLSLEKIED